MTEPGWSADSMAPPPDHPAATAHPPTPPRSTHDRSTVSRRAIMSWILGAAALGVVAGLGAGLLGNDTRRSATYTPGTTTTPNAPATGLTNPPIAPPTAGPAITGVEPEPRAIAETFASSPWKTAGLELSRVYEISETGNGYARMHVDRLTVYSGASAKAYYQQHPAMTPAARVTINKNPRRYTFTVAAGSSIYASTLVGREGPPSAVSTKDFVSGVQAALAAKREVYVWLRHDDTDGGWITYVAEAAESKS